MCVVVCVCVISVELNNEVADAPTWGVAPQEQKECYCTDLVIIMFLHRSNKNCYGVTNGSALYKYCRTYERVSPSKPFRTQLILL